MIYDVAIIGAGVIGALTAREIIFTETEAFFTRLETLGEHSKCTFILNVSCDTDALPPFVSRYLI